MVKKTTKIDQLLELVTPRISRWELDNVIWSDRATNPETLSAFLTRIKTLQSSAKKSVQDKLELEILLEFADNLDIKECKELLSNDDDLVQQHFIESLARKGALETLCDNKLSMDTMNTMCKLSPSDFILTAKRSQDIINSIRELVIQGETLSNDVAGA